MQDLCASDWTKLFSNLSDKIISKVSVVEFRLERPANAKTIVVTIDGKIADSSTWKYDAGKNALTFAPEKAPADGAKVLVIYSGI